MKKGLVWLIGIALIVLLAGFWMIGKYNAFVGQDQLVVGRWAQVENQLQRRYDLIPNLVETVKGYQIHEKDVFTSIARERSKLAGAATVSEKVAASFGLEGALSRLLAIVENYPQLKADLNFRQLMDSLEGSENRLAVERMRYNEAVQNYNIFAKRIPNNFFAAAFGFGSQKVFFKSPEAAKEAPKVRF